MRPGPRQALRVFHHRLREKRGESYEPSSQYRRVETTLFVLCRGRRGEEKELLKSFFHSGGKETKRSHQTATRSSLMAIGLLKKENSERRNWERRLGKKKKHRRGLYLGKGSSITWKEKKGTAAEEIGGRGNYKNYGRK